MTRRDRAAIERLIRAVEGLRLDLSRRRAGSRRRLIVESLLSGLFRALGFAMGFSGLGALLAMALRALTRQSFGGFLSEVIRAIEERM